MTVEKIIKDLISLAERNICEHEETHRGGAIWTICDQCGAKWADDEGGKPEYKEPKAITNARAYLDKTSQLKTMDYDRFIDIITSLRNASKNQMFAEDWQKLFADAVDELVIRR